MSEVAGVGSVLAARAVGFAPGGAVLAGLTAGLAFLVIVWDAISGGVTRMGYLYVVGAGVSPEASRGSQVGLGLVVHGVLSTAYGLAYAALLRAFGVSSIGDATAIGLLIGLAQGALAMVVAGWVLAHVHALVRHGDLPQPGKALTGYGRSTPFVWIVAHAVFGVTVGAVYAAAAL